MVKLVVSMALIAGMVFGPVTGEAVIERGITPVVSPPEIVKKLEIRVTLDFRDVRLDRILGFITDTTGVNIITSSGAFVKEKRATIRVKDLPLKNALRYLLKGQGLMFRVEKNAVWVATSEEMEQEAQQTRVYSLYKGSGLFVEFSEAVDNESGLGSAAHVSRIKTIKDTLINAVNWPKGSRLVLDERTGALIVTNTPSNLQVIENIIYKLDVTPVQVLIEARFIELEVTDITELGLEWGLRSDGQDEGWYLERKGNRGRTEIEKGSGLRFTDFTNQSLGFNLNYQGVMWHPQFEFVLHALERSGKSKTLSAPKVTALNNQTATIEVITEDVYSTAFELGVVWEDDGDGIREINEVTVQNVPTAFITRKVGKILKVTPSVGADMKTITLTLVPEVSAVSSSTYTYGTVTIPSFESRSVSTTVVLEDGQTVILGGLIKETETKTVTKVPLLGDIPILGRLFRKDSSDVTRKNLLIFITASIVPFSEKVASQPLP